MAQKPTVADLEKGVAFELIDEVEYASIHQWIQRYLFRIGWITGPFWLLNILAVVVIIVQWRRADTPILEAVPTVCVGMVFGVLALLPIHEHIHGLAYRMMGASNAQVRYELRRVTAYCVAPDQVFSSKEYAFVCLAPFAVLNPLLTVAALVAPAGPVALLLAGALLMHTGACSGDFAIVEYLWSRRGDPVFTFDDSKRERACMYRGRR